MVRGGIGFLRGWGALRKGRIWVVAVSGLHGWLHGRGPRGQI